MENKELPADLVDMVAEVKACIPAAKTTSGGGVVMKYWIFKAIYYPTGFIILVAATSVLLLILSKVDLKTPFTWLCGIYIAARIGDYLVNK